MRQRPSSATREHPDRLADPDHRPHADEVLRGELREAAGRDVDPVTAHVPVRSDTVPRLRAQASPVRFLFAVLLGTGLVGLTLLVLLLGGGLWALVPLAVMVAVLVLFTGWVLRSTRDVEALSPEHRAALEEAGVVDPDHELNVRVRDLAGAAPVGPLPAGDHPTRPEDDPPEAAREQQDAWTPSSGPSRRIGR